jgi:uncharacterized protein (TIGR02246 family)
MLGVEFAEAVDAHLAAVARRDLDGYLATVHDDVTLITPMGGLLAGRADVEGFHRDWFGDPDWSWQVAPVRSVVAGDTGVAVLSVDYRDVDGAGKPVDMRYVLSLVFARLNGRWLLLHDQNTIT